MAVDLFYFSNVTLGFGSPQHIAFIKVCLKKELFGKIITIEPFEKVRPVHNIEDFNCKRIIPGNGIWKNTFFKFFNNSYKLSEYIVKPINSLLLGVYVLFVAVTSYFKKIAIVTCDDHVFYGLFSKQSIICQNFSEIWQENKQINKRSIIYQCKQGLLSRYRKNVRFVIAPQEDRLEMVKGDYINADCFLVHNAPSSLINFTMPSNLKTKAILYQGRVSQLSLADDLIAFAEALPVDIEMHIAGIVNKEYVEKINALNNKENITFHGYLKWDALAELRSKCNIGILAWSNDSLNTKYCAPNKLYEYIASGMYVVCFDNFSLSKLHQEFSFGYLEHNTAKNLAAFVTSLSMASIIEQGNKNHHLFNNKLNFEIESQALFNAFFSACK